MSALLRAGVKCVADVRAVPFSRRPGFSKNILAAGLREADIAHVGLKALGTPPAGREAARKGDHARLAEVYAGQLELPQAIAQGALLCDLVNEMPDAESRIYLHERQLCSQIQLGSSPLTNGRFDARAKCAEQWQWWR